MVTMPLSGVELMRKLVVSALLLPLTTSALAQSTSSVEIRPAYDTPQERQALRKMTVCIAEQRPRWARELLARPYLSTPQASAATAVVSGRDKCLGAPERAVAFRISGVVGAVAEQLIRVDLPKTDLTRVSTALATVTPLNVSEDFALCLAARNPTAALELATSDPGSAGEAQASARVGAGVPSCTRPGEQLQVDVQSLRALVSTALYRGVSAALITRS